MPDRDPEPWIVVANGRADELRRLRARLAARGVRAELLSTPGAGKT